MEKEKMLKQEWFDNSDPWMAEQRFFAGNIAIRYNQTAEEDLETRRRLLQSLLGHLGEHSFIATGVRFDYGCNVYIGDDVFVNFNAVFLDCGEIRIGDRVLIGPNCSFLTPVHPMLAEERRYQIAEDGHKYFLLLAKPIVLEDDVWLGGNVTVMPGVTIGRNAIIGAGSVVTGDIPANSVAMGNPCKVVRAVTPEDTLYKT